MDILCLVPPPRRQEGGDLVNGPDTDVCGMKKKKEKEKKRKAKKGKRERE